MKKLLALSLLIILFSMQTASAGYAPTYTSGTLTNDSTNSLGASSVTILPANAGRKYFFMENLSSNLVCCNAFGAAVCGTAPTVTLVQYGTWSMSGAFIYTGAVQCIASGSSTSLVAYEGQ